MSDNRDGPDPSRHEAVIGAPELDTQGTVGQCPEAPRVGHKRGRQSCVLCMETAEPVFGQIQWGRRFRQFLPRGLKKVAWEWQPVRDRLGLFGYGARARNRGLQRQDRQLEAVPERGWRILF